MKLRIRVTVTTLVLATVGLLGLTACGTAAGNAADAVLSPEASVLSAMGFAVPDQAGADATPAPDTSAGTKADKARRLHRARVYLRRNTLHGEVVVQTSNGDRTIDVQRGEITAITGTTVTVKSTDGFTLLWTTTDKTRVAQHRTRVGRDTLKVGQKVGLAGVKVGDTVTARLIVIAAS